MGEDCTPVELDYRNLAHMYLLASAVERAPETAYPYLCGFIVDFDLMRPQWWVRCLLWLVRRRHGHTLFFWQNTAKHHPSVCQELIAGTADWIRRGKDRTTNDAAGGFNSMEVEHMQAFLDELGVDLLTVSSSPAPNRKTENGDHHGG